MTAVDETQPDEGRPVNSSRHRDLSDWYWRIALFLSSVAVSVVGTTIAIRSADAADRKWCSIITTLDDSWREQPPTQPSGKNVAAGIADLRREFHCP